MSENKTTMEMMLKGNKDKIKAALPRGIQVDRTIALASNIWNTNDFIRKCTPNTFASSVFQAVSMGLELSPTVGHAYLVPFKNKKKGVFECQLQVGYKGLIELAKRSKESPQVWARVVYSNDLFQFELGTEERIKHVPCMDKDRGEFSAAYAVMKTQSGETRFEVLPAWEITQIRDKFSKGGNYGPWVSSFDEMAKKTVTKRLLKYASLSAEVQNAIAHDDLSQSGAEQETLIDLKDVSPEPKKIIKTSAKNTESNFPNSKLAPDDIPPEEDYTEVLEPIVPEKKEPAKKDKKTKIEKKEEESSTANHAPVIIRYGKHTGQNAWELDTVELAIFIEEIKAQFGNTGRQFPEWFKEVEKILVHKHKEDTK